MSGKPDFRGVLVTGGSSGIGAAVTAAHVSRGDRVVILDNQSSKSNSNDLVRYVYGDVTNYSDNVSAVSELIEFAGRIDHFVGNAGIHDGGFDFVNTPGEDLEVIMRQVLNVDVVGYALGARACVEELRKTRGCMTFTLSDASYIVTGNNAGLAYTSAKHAALGLVRHLASELAPYIRVNAVAPGGVVTQLRARQSDGSEEGVFEDAATATERIAKFNPLGVVASPAELAELYLFLASPTASAMTGEILRPDGGLSVRQNSSNATPQERTTEGESYVDA